MSFHVMFNARNRGTARKILKKMDLPPPVLAFLFEGLHALNADQPVFVKAVGHLYDDIGSYTISTAELCVTPIDFIEPETI